MQSQYMPRYTKNDVFLIMFFNDSQYHSTMLNNIESWACSIDDQEIKLLISDFITLKNYDYDFRTFFNNQFPVDFKNEMLLYFGKHAVILSDENFEHMMNKVIAK